MRTDVIDSPARRGFGLFTLALFTGFAVPAFLNHRMAVAAHVTGVLNALVLIAVGVACFVDLVIWIVEKAVG